MGVTGVGEPTLVISAHLLKQPIIPNDASLQYQPVLSTPTYVSCISIAQQYLSPTCTYLIAHSKLRFISNMHFFQQRSKKKRHPPSPTVASLHTKLKEQREQFQHLVRDMEYTYRECGYNCYMYLVSDHYFCCTAVKKY